MRVRVLGSGTLLPDPRRGAPGFWVDTGEETFLMDCGSGTLGTLARFGLRWEETSHVLLTHFHTDHCADLAPLLFAMKHGAQPLRTTPLTLLGPVGLGEHLKALEAAHGTYIGDPGFPLQIKELTDEDVWVSPGGGVRVRSYATNHSERSLAFRMERGRESVGFTGDTGPDPGLGAFMGGVDLLVAECAFPDGQGMVNHLTPSALLELASMASPELLVNVHGYPPLDPEKVPGLLREAGYTGRALAGRDGMLIRVSSGDIRVEKDAG